MPTASLLTNLASVLAATVLLAAAGARAAAAASLSSSSSSSWPPSPQLRRNASCLRAGLPPDLTAFRFALPLPDKHVFAPVISSAGLGVGWQRPDPAVRHAVVWVHGGSGNANDYFCDGLAAAAAAAPKGSVISVAPWFGDTQVTASAWASGRTLPSTAKLSSAWWPKAGAVTGWSHGGDGADGRTSSFEVLDGIVAALAASKHAGRFPNLERITVCGFSGGGQLVSRWALFSPVATTNSLTSGGSSSGGSRTRGGGGINPVAVRTIAADGGSWLYLSPERPDPYWCSPLHDTGTNHSCPRYLEPARGDCSGYDDYYFGLRQVQAAGSYFTRFTPAVLAEAVSTYVNRTDIKFMVGTGDACNCVRQVDTHTSSSDHLRDPLCRRPSFLPQAVRTAASYSCRSQRR